MGKISTAAGWIIQSLIFSLLMASYYYYLTPHTLLEGLMAFTFCIVTAWFSKKLIVAMLKS